MKFIITEKNEKGIILVSEEIELNLLSDYMSLYPKIMKLVVEDSNTKEIIIKRIA